MNVGYYGCDVAIVLASTQDVLKYTCIYIHMACSQRSKIKQTDQ